MRSNLRSILMISGAVAALGGLVMMITGRMIGLLVFLIGLGMLIFGCALLMHTGGYRMEGIFLNGFSGKGRQQSEVDKAYLSDSGEQSPAIWETITGKKE